MRGSVSPMEKIGTQRAEAVPRRHSTRLWKGWQREVGRVGYGVEVKSSDVAGGGNGLWATWYFLKGQIITYYEGRSLSREEALARQAEDPRNTTHFLSIGHHEIIDGLRDPATAVGCGGASFANTVVKRPGLINAKFVKRGQHAVTYMVLVATRDIQPGEEIYVAYKQSYFLDIFGIDPRDQFPTVLISDLKELGLYTEDLLANS